VKIRVWIPLECWYCGTTYRSESIRGVRLDPPCPGCGCMESGDPKETE
jgi:hypothetical protein